MTQFDLLDFSAKTESSSALVDENQVGHKADEFDQYITPEYVAALVAERFCADLKPGSTVFDVGCGRGAFLKYIPPSMQAFGIEIDPAMAEYAVENTGRPVIIGDFRTVPLNVRPDAIIGNPPFTKKVVDGFLERAHTLLPDGGKAGLLLPAYHMQSSRPTMRWHEMFSMEQSMIPREIFPGLTKPLNYVVFTKEKVRRLTGFFLYPEVADAKQFKAAAKLVLVHGKPKKGVWRAVVEEAISRKGGKASLADIYEFVGDKRPTENVWWKEQVRKVLQGDSFVREDSGYAMAA